MRKQAGYALAAVLLAGSLAGCSKAPEGNQEAAKAAGDQPITLKFASWSISEAATKDALEQMADAFHKKHPNVTIQFVGIPFGDIKQQTFVMASSGNAPDIMQTFPSWFSTYAASDIIVPVDDLLGKDYVNDILPSFKEDFSYQGKLMGVPWAPTPYILYYNKELFKKAGLPETPPKTYEEMMEAARKIAKLKTDAGEKVYGLGEATDKLAINGMIALKNIYSFGGSVLDKNGKVNVNTPEVIEALKHYQTLANEELTPQGAKLKDLRSLFSLGQLGMYVDGYYGKAVFRNLSGKGEAFDKVWGAALIPAGKSGKSVSIGEAHGLVISSASKNKEMAAEFVKFLTDKDMITLYHKQSDVLTARQSLSSLPEFTTAEFDKVLMEQFKYVQPLPQNTPGLEQAYLDIAEALQKVTVAKQDPAKVAAELDAKLKQSIK